MEENIYTIQCVKHEYAKKKATTSNMILFAGTAKIEVIDVEGSPGSVEAKRENTEKVNEHTSQQACPKDVKKYLEAAKYSQEVVVPLLITLESQQEDYEKMCNRRMSLHEMITLLHFGLENWKDERYNLEQEVRNLKRMLAEVTTFEEEMKNGLAQVLCEREEAEKKQKAEVENLTKQIKLLRKKNEDLRAYISKVETLAEERGVKVEETKKILQGYQETCAKLTQEKNDLEERVTSAEEVRRRVEPVVEAYFAAELDTSELEVLRGVREELEALEEEDPTTVRVKIGQLGSRVVRELAAIRSFVEMAVSEIRGQIGGGATTTTLDGKGADMSS